MTMTITTWPEHVVLAAHREHLSQTGKEPTRAELWKAVDSPQFYMPHKHFKVSFDYLVKSGVLIRVGPKGPPALRPGVLA
jgi:hypothetical protein